MAGWHTRLWRRVRVAPGVTVNLGKSGPSVSVGPRGSKVTVGRRGLRQTVGIPGTGLYATRQVSSSGHQPTPTPGAAAVPGAAVPAAEAAIPDDQIELYYGLATVVGVVLGLALLAMGVPVGQAAVVAVLAIVAGIAYEGLAHHHPGPAKVLAQVTVGLLALAAAILGAIAVGVLAGALLGSTRRRRRR